MMTCQVRLDTMLEVPKLPSLSDTELVMVQKQACLTPNAPAPSIESMLHAMIPYTFVDHSHSDSVCLLTNTPEAKQFIAEVYGPNALVVDYCIPGFVLAKTVSEMVQGADWSKIEVIILLNHGIFTWGNDAKTSYETMIKMVNKAEDFMKAKKAYFETLENGSAERPKLDTVGLAELRKEVSKAAGVPMVMKSNNSYEAQVCVGF